MSIERGCHLLGMMQRKHPDTPYFSDMPAAFFEAILFEYLKEIRFVCTRNRKFSTVMSSHLRQQGSNRNEANHCYLYDLDTLRRYTRLLCTRPE